MLVNYVQPTYGMNALPNKHLHAKKGEELVSIFCPRALTAAVVGRMSFFPFWVCHLLSSSTYPFSFSFSCLVRSFAPVTFMDLYGTSWMVLQKLEQYLTEGIF